MAHDLRSSHQTFQAVTHDRFHDARSAWEPADSSCRGAVLLVVLIVFSALSLLAFGLCHRVRLELKITRMQSDELRSYHLALGGIRRAMAALRADEDREVDHFGEAWRLDTSATEEAFFQGQDGVRPGEYELSYATSDEEGRLNVNTSSPAGWATLPGLSEPVVYSILDWQDEDDHVGPGGAESPEYLQAPYGYRAKNGPITMVWELARVMHVDWFLFLGEDANGNYLLDSPEEDDGPRRRPEDNADGTLDLGILDYFTVYGDGKINLNTASEPVMAAIPGISAESARRLADYRVGADGQAFTADDRFFTSFSDLTQVQGLTDLDVELLSQHGTFRSSHFRIVSQALNREDARGIRLIGTVRRDGDGVRLVLLHRVRM